MKAVLLLLGLAVVTCTTWAQDRADIDRTQIIGNRELPKVLYIVPWKKPLPGTLSGRPVQSVLDEALSPVDREVFRRQVDYNSQVQARATSVVPITPTAPAVATTPTTNPSPAATPR